MDKTIHGTHSLYKISTIRSNGWVGSGCGLAWWEEEESDGDLRVVSSIGEWQETGGASVRSLLLFDLVIKTGLNPCNRKDLNPSIFGNFTIYPYESLIILVLPVLPFNFSPSLSAFLNWAWVHPTYLFFQKTNTNNSSSKFNFGKLKKTFPVCGIFYEVE